MSDIDKRIKEYYRQREELIARAGWMIQGVFTSSDASDEGNFAYTIGLAAKGLPEIICTANISLQTLSMFINPLADHLVKNRTLPDNINEFLNATINKELARFGWWDIKDLHAAKSSYLFQAVQRHNSNDIKAIQLIVADKNNVLPDEEGYDTSFIQPLL